MRLPEQECSGHAEGESDLKRMCQPGENCRNQVGSQLLLQLWFWKPQYSERSTNVTQRTDMEITSLACFRHLLIRGHC